MKNKYNVIVVGAGPAGSTAARFSSMSGASVLLLEKDREIGLPVRCAEGVGEKGIELVVKLQENWLAQKISGVIFNSPSDKRVEVVTNDVGYILDRKIFDWELANIAAKEGAEVLTKAYVNGLLFEDDKVAGVKLEHLGKSYKIKADIVIGADGVESRVGRWAGIKTKLALQDVETCAQVTVANIDVEMDRCHFYFSNKECPKGYNWIFPKGNGIANVGLGVSGEYARYKPPIEILNEFLAKRFPNVSPLTTVVGGVPVALPLEQLVADGLMLVGDAGRQANPVSGGGITSGMIAAKAAGQVAAAAVSEGNFSKKRLNEYVKLWNKAEGNKHKIFYKLKSFVYNLTDEELDSTATMLLNMPMEKRNLVSIFRSALVRHPSLIVDIIKVFT